MRHSRRMGPSKSAWFVATTLLVACGGVVENGPASPGDAGGASASSGGSSSDSLPGSGAPSGGSPTSVALSACKLGFLPASEPSAACNFVYDGRCYDDKLSACACACTKKSGTYCLSNLPVPNGKVAVSCD